MNHQYTQFQYLWPPRPEKPVPVNFLKVYEQKKWVAQFKKNGTCNVIAVGPDRQITAMNRHNEMHKSWEPTRASSELFRQLPGSGWYVFVAELLHSKVEGLRDINYLHDILVADGEYLVGTPFIERQRRLKALLVRGGEVVTDSHTVLNPNTWLARTYAGGFTKLFNGLSRPEDEGLVVKNPNAVLTLCSRPSANADWQAKCRVGTKNYTF